MKFAHELKEALQREGFPAHWVESAIPYGQLKKCIKKVEGELRSLGLDAETLRHLIPSCPAPGVQRTRRGSGDAPVAFQYHFGGMACVRFLLVECANFALEDLKAFPPKLTLYIQLDDGVAIDAGLSPNTRKYLEDLASKQRPPASSSASLASEVNGCAMQDDISRQ